MDFYPILLNNVGTSYLEMWVSGLNRNPGKIVPCWAAGSNPAVSAVWMIGGVV